MACAADLNFDLPKIMERLKMAWLDKGVVFVFIRVFIHYYNHHNFFFKDDNSEDKSDDSEEPWSDDDHASVGCMDFFGQQVKNHDGGIPNDTFNLFTFGCQRYGSISNLVCYMMLLMLRIC